MKTFAGLLVALSVVIWLGLAPAVAQAAIFVKFEGAPGESKDKDHGGWSDVLSVNHRLAGAASPNFSAGGSTAARTAFDFSVTKPLDKATPKLNLFCANGAHISRVVIEKTQTGSDARKVVYLQYLLDDVVVTGVETDFSGDDWDGGREKVTLRFAKITCIYTERDERGNPKGNVSYSWSLAANKEEPVGPQTSSQSSGQTPPGTLIQLKDQQAPTRLFRLNP